MVVRLSDQFGKHLANEETSDFHDILFGANKWWRIYLLFHSVTTGCDYCTTLPQLKGVCSKRRQVKTATSQNIDKPKRGY